MNRHKVRVWVVAVVCSLLLGLLSHRMVRAQGLNAHQHATRVANAGGTLVLNGSLTSAAEVTMTGAFSVGEAHNLHWDLPRVTSVAESGYSEELQALSYAFTVQPDSYSDTMVDGRAVREFVWQSPPQQTVIHVTEALKVLVRSDLAPFHSVAPYPVSQVPAEVAPWLAMTSLVKLPAAAASRVNMLKHGARDEQSIVTAVIDWVATSTLYDHTRGGSAVSAANVFASHRAICRGFDNLAVGILRTLGIPARVEYGWVSATRLNLPGPNHSRSYVQWSVPGTQGELHTWLSVYFPDTGWVPVDPQREKFFVDPHHLAFYSNIDGGIPTAGQWSADYFGSASPTGPSLSDGTEEIVPGDGNASAVTVHTRDTVRATLQSFQHDVKNVLLFAR